LRGPGDDCFDPEKNPALKKNQARPARFRPDASIKKSSSWPPGPDQIDFETFTTDWDSEAYLTVSGQNSNNSVRLSDDFCARSSRTAIGP